MNDLLIGLAFPTDNLHKHVRGCQDHTWGICRCSVGGDLDVVIQPKWPCVEAGMSSNNTCRWLLWLIVNLTKCNILMPLRDMVVVLFLILLF